MANFEITHYEGALVENTKISFRNLYLRRFSSGPDKNQLVLIDGYGSTDLGLTAANNWAIYDGIGPEAELVARAQGLHTNVAGNWYNSFIMVFEIQRFKDSTLEIMGATVEKEGEWAIVGGTGGFAMARGVIHRKVHENTADGEILELTIDAFCRRKLPILTKLGPWGIQGPKTHDIQDKPERLESVTIRHGASINAMSFSYIDQAGQIHAAGPFGTDVAGHVTKTVLGPEEYVMEITGTIDNTYKCLATLELVTNIKTYGYGKPPAQGTPFSASVPKNGRVVGFFGTSGFEVPWLSSIGVYLVS